MKKLLTFVLIMFISMSTNLFVLSTHAQEKDSNVETDIPELNNMMLLMI
jgi:hypothetical protein